MHNLYLQPTTLEEALQNKRDTSHARLLAGGTDFYIRYCKNNPSDASDILDVTKIAELNKIRLEGDGIYIGATATFTDIVDIPLLQEKIPFLCKAAMSVGSPQIRNRGTIGGNICNANPAADSLPPLVTLEAQAILQSMDAQGVIQSRTVPLEHFILAKEQTAIKETEILTAVVFKCPADGAQMAFDKIGRRNALAIARLNGACLIQRTGQHIQSVKIVLGAATSKPERFYPVEDYLTDKDLSDKTLQEAGTLAADYVLEKTGRRASSTYKLPVIARFTRALIQQAIEEETL